MYPVGIIPDNLLAQADTAPVVAWLVDQVMPGYYKRGLLQGWGKIVDVKPSQADYAKVDASGVTG